MLNVTVSDDEGHDPFEIVQTNVFAPTLIPVTPEVGEEGVVTIELPEITVHKPVPTNAMFPSSVAEGAQKI